MTERTYAEAPDARWHTLYKLGGVAALLQLGSLLLTAVVIAAVGPTPTTVKAAFSVLQGNAFEGLLRLEVLLIPLLGLYLVMFPALCVALWRINPTYVGLSALFTFVAVTCFFAGHPAFSMLHLSKHYAAATTAAQRTQLLAAGEAIIAADGWNSSAGYVGGFLLQGSGVIISIVMLRSKNFSKVTAYSGLLANAFDLVQHLLHPFVPEVMGIVTPAMGIFYLIWFPMLARDLFRLEK